MAENEFIFGPHSILAAIKAGKRKIHKIYITEKNSLSEEIYLEADKRNIKIVSADKDKISALTKAKNHQGIAADVSSLPFLDFDEFLNSKLFQNKFAVILDSLEDPLNLGSIARSALCLGADVLIIPKDRSVRPTPFASKISAGALEYIPLIVQTNIVNTIKDLKTNGFWIGGLDGDGSDSIENSLITPPFALVVGSEGKGIRPLVRKNLDFIFKIDQRGPVTSLNASSAAAIGIYECAKKIRI
ncbi:MAG: 23S rRNA (guanosine(2251)-2'-O)-methyltransferase RlmB [Desulfobacteraceae bacterium]|nr:23S rRNA (guanosine(2251)-2'-O)-methyltransferase RlmB [Desulfobacteraceae bacterium]